MEKYILITAAKLKYILSEKEKQAVFTAISEKEKQVVIQGEMIPLHITPSVVKFERWYAQELERLALSGKRLCKKCLKIMDIVDKCSCWEETGTGKKQDAFIAPTEQIKQITDKWSFPALTEEDKIGIEEDEEKRLAAPQYTENGYIDKESGEEMHS